MHHEIMGTCHAHTHVGGNFSSLQASKYIIILMCLFESEVSDSNNGRFTRVPSRKSRFTLGQSMQSQPLRAWMLGLIGLHGSQVLSFKYDMEAYTLWR
jgi:hypothetical protein